MQSNRNVVEKVLENSLGDSRTLLPVNTVVTYSYTFPYVAVVKHTTHPNA